MKRLVVLTVPLCGVALLLAAQGASLAVEGDNPIFRELTTRGVAIAGEEALRLPPPTLSDGLTATEQRQRIEALAEGRYTWEDLTRRSVMAPFLLKTAQENDSEARTGRRADLWFIAYGDLDTLGSDAFLRGQFKTPSDDTTNPSAARLLEESDLRKRDLPPAVKPEDPRFVAAEISLLERVRVSVTTCTVKTRAADSILAASLLDPRFAADAEFPNRWRPILRDDNGVRQWGETHPYAGLGSYVKASRLVEPQGAILIEYHVAYAEPAEWFNGANLLRSKLPIIAQTVARQVRRNLQQQ